MTETQRDAMQQALEFCESVQGGCTDSDDGTVEAITVWCPEVIEVLRAALAEPEPPIWQTLAEIGASAPAGTWDAPVGPPASPSLTPAHDINEAK